VASIPNDQEILSHIQGYFSGGSELFRHLEMDITSASDEGIEARFKPGAEHLGAQADASPFGGVITTILDSLFGLAVMVELNAPSPIATVNLRIDFVDTVPVSGDLLFNARCTGIDERIARTEGVCTLQSTGAPVARAIASFAIGTKGPAFNAAMVEEVPGDG